MISDAAATTMAATARLDDLLEAVAAAVASKTVSICMGDYCLNSTVLKTLCNVRVP